MAAALFLMLTACVPVVDAAAARQVSDVASVDEALSARSLTLVAADGSRTALAFADLATMPRQQVPFARHDNVSVYEGPLLLDVLARAGVAASPLRRPDQATAVLITAADGYQVVFGLGETDPATRPNRIIIALQDDGALLSERDGPFMVVAEGDLRAARSPRQVVSIQILPLGVSPT